MVEKTSSNVQKRDLDLILEVNRKAIEIEMEVVEQNEEVIKYLTDIQKTQTDIDAKIDKLVEKTDSISKDLFKIQVLFVTGLLSLVVQIFQIFFKH